MMSYSILKLKRAERNNQSVLTAKEKPPNRAVRELI